jgi:hypothetical protein
MTVQFSTDQPPLLLATSGEEAGDDLVAAIEQQWRAWALSFAEQDYECFRGQLRDVRFALYRDLRQLSCRLDTPEGMRRCAEMAVERFHGAATQFLQARLSGERGRTAVAEQLSSLAHKIESAEVSFEPLSRIVHTAVDSAERGERIEEMLTARLCAAAGEALGILPRRAIEWICTSHPLLESACRETADFSAQVVNSVAERIPQDVRRWWAQLEENRRVNVLREVESNEERYGILRSMTEQFHADLLPAALTVVGGAAAFGRGSGRYMYASGYVEARQAFAEAPREFRGALSRDLTVVQYHCDAAVQEGRSLAWFTPVHEVNPLHTVDEVMDRLALLRCWSERTQVTVARIPAGEPVRFLYGRARAQHDLATGERRPGGGVQYRFYNFDPNWILETRELPGLRATCE